MSASTLLYSTPRAQVKVLEECIAAGDIAGMAQAIEALHCSWEHLSDPMRKDILQLEAIFLSMVKMKNGVH